MKKILFILFLLPMAVMAQFSASLGSPIGGSFMGASANGLGSFGAPMQTVNPITWSAESREIDASKVEISLKTNIQEGWHLYSQHQNGTGLPLKLEIQPNGNFRPNNSLFWIESPKYIEVFEPILKTTERYLASEATFSTSIIRCNADTFSVKVNISGQACQDDGMCVPVEETITVLVPASSAEMLASGAENSEENLLWFFLLAFGGGLLGILTPCVLPMIPMTVSYFLKHGGKKYAVFYAVSIVLIYILLGLVLSILLGHDFANILSTHWLPNILFTLIFIVFALSLFGYYEISLPSKWVNTSVKNEERAGYVGVFFMALTLVLVSFSCTLPIAGAVALGAANGSFLKPLIGMLGFSLAFALPFGLFAFFPNLLNKMPKSSSWMGTLKVILGFVELAFALKFFSVPDQTYHWGLLSRELYLGIWIVLFTLLGLYLLGVIKFPINDGDPSTGSGTKISWKRIVSANISFIFVVYMITGYFGAPLEILSGWLPPKTEKIEHIDGVSHSGKLQGIHGVNCYFDYEEALAVAKTAGKPVFIDFTGHGCVNCRKMEELVLSNAEIINILNEKYVVCALYVDDKVIKLDEPYITAEGNTLEYLGQKNTYIQSKIYGYNAQPCYIIVDAATGAKVKEPMFYETDVNAFIEYLR
ncbi:MAG: cytochrome c biogenesis protein CcdA [Paludibacteraceae bacterium]|nr:cytochrome c biogenesis protein CcdA [Paludibacteraceae bacterium]